MVSEPGPPFRSREHLGVGKVILCNLLSRFDILKMNLVIGSWIEIVHFPHLTCNHNKLIPDKVFVGIVVAAVVDEGECRKQGRAYNFSSIFKCSI